MEYFGHWNNPLQSSSSEQMRLPAVYYSKPECRRDLAPTWDHTGQIKLFGSCFFSSPFFFKCSFATFSNVHWSPRMRGRFGRVLQCGLITITRHLLGRLYIRFVYPPLVTRKCRQSVASLSIGGMRGWAGCTEYVFLCVRVRVWAPLVCKLSTGRFDRL